MIHNLLKCQQIDWWYSIFRRTALLQCDRVMQALTLSSLRYGAWIHTHEYENLKRMKCTVPHPIMVYNSFNIHANDRIQYAIRKRNWIASVMITRISWFFLSKDSSFLSSQNSQFREICFYCCCSAPSTKPTLEYNSTSFTFPYLCEEVENDYCSPERNIKSY